ncbi:unnamed protein product [Agarophyton chilense]
MNACTCTYEKRRHGERAHRSSQIQLMMTPSCARTFSNAVARASLWPLLQASTISVTISASVHHLVSAHPSRRHLVPFYSDATQRDPERVFLALGENVSLVFALLSLLCEHAVHTRCAQACEANASTRALVRAHVGVGACALLMWLLTANLPTVRPFISAHQMTASLLMTSLAVQATLKARLARMLHNFEYNEQHNHDDDDDDDDDDYDNKNHKSRWQRAWHRYHTHARDAIAGVLWMGVFGTFLLFGVRHSTLVNVSVRRRALLVMTAVVHATTVAAVALMLTAALDLRRHHVTAVAHRVWPTRSSPPLEP